jgi:hypothetical protein
LAAMTSWLRSPRIRILEIRDLFCITAQSLRVKSWP